MSKQDEWDAEFQRETDAWARSQEQIAAIERVERAIREPGERARAEERGRQADEALDRLADEDAKRTPEQREERRLHREQQAQWFADIAREDRAKAKAKRIQTATRTLIVASVGLVLLVIGTIALWSYGMSKYDPNATPSWGEAARILGAVAIAVVTFGFAIYWLGTIWGVLRSLVSKA